MILWQFGLFGAEGQDPTAIDPCILYGLLYKVATWAAMLIGAFALIYLIIGALQYLTAGGNPARQGEAKKAILAALIGLLLVISAFSLVNALLKELQFSDNMRSRVGIKALCPTNR